MTQAAYRHLAEALAVFRQRAEASDWASAGELIAALEGALASGKVPAATPGDRAAIEAALADLASVRERSEALHADLARLLAALGETPHPA